MQTLNFQFLLTRSLPAFFILLSLVHVFVSVLEEKGYSLGAEKVIKSQPYLCEYTHEGQIFQQPTSAFTSLAYNLMAFLVIAVDYPSEHLPIKSLSQNSLKWIFFTLLNMVGLTSFYFHGFLTAISMWADFFAMLCNLSVFCGFTISRWFSGNHFKTAVVSVFSLLMSIRLIGFFNGYDTTLLSFALGIIGTLVSEYTRYWVYESRRRKEVDSIPYFEKNDMKKAISPRTGISVISPRTGKTPKIEQSVETLNELVSEHSESQTETSELNHHEDIHLLNGALFAGVMATTAQILIMDRVGCFFKHSGSFQLHGVFHFCTAFVIAFLYCYMASGSLSFSRKYQ